MLSKQPVSIEVHCASDYAKIPLGHFVCEGASGKRTLGNNTLCGLYWDVPKPASLTKKQVGELPIVRLRFAQLRPGVAQLGDVVIIDTHRLDGFDGAF